MKITRVVTIATMILFLTGCSMGLEPRRLNAPTGEGAGTELEPAGPVTGKARVVAVQRALNARRGARLPLDGRMGRRTRAALREFQTAQGLEVTGRLDAKTLEALGITNGDGATRRNQDSAPIPR